MNPIIVKQPKDVPLSKHFAILTFERVSEESYGETSIRTVPCYTVYFDRKQWEGEMSRLFFAKEPFVPLVVAEQPIVSIHYQVKIPNESH